MKEHIAAIRRADATIAEATKKIERIAGQRAKIASELDGAAQISSELQLKAARALAAAALGEGDQKAADALAADLATAEGKARNKQLALSGFDEQEAQARAAIAVAEQERGVAVRGALAARMDVLAVEYRERALALADSFRRIQAVYLVRRSLNQPEDHGYTVWRSPYDSERFIIPALAHPAFVGDTAGPNGECVYAAAGEGYDPRQGKQGEALAAELELLKSAGVPV